MSLSLSSLLNPSPDAETQQNDSSSPPLPQKDPLPPMQYVQSPTQQGATPSNTAHPSHGYSHPAATESDAVQALAALSSSAAAPPTQSQWHSQEQTMEGQVYERRGSSYEHARPGSSGMQLPKPPPPPATADRKMSSPTLDQYRVSSRSPEQRRSSLISPSQNSGVTLPPIQSFGNSHQNHSAMPSSDHEQMEVSAHSAAPPTFTEQSTHAPNGLPTGTAHAPTYAANQPSLQGRPTSPSNVKQEVLATPQPSSPANAQNTPLKPGENEVDSVKAIASLKNEHGLRTASPLRESSVPVPSTELSPPEPTVSKKRPAPARPKKGMATTKKAPPAKKRKVEAKRSVTPSSRASKMSMLKTASSTGTPANSSPAPSTRSVSATPYSEDEDMDEGPAGSDDELYCICRKPDNGTFMIGCDGTCDDWFHGKCVEIAERDKNLIDKYICPSCTEKGVGRTTWKRYCRRQGCRQPARSRNVKNGKEGSKYCSDECGVQCFRDMVAKTRGKEETTKHRSSRRKPSMVNERAGLDDDLGARGGVLAAGELKSLVNTSKTAEDFKRFGEGVLSPPATPSSSPTADKKQHGIDFTDSENQSLENITHKKDEARRKHNVLKDRLKFVNLAKQAASRTATERELKPKEYCGYDSRIEWTEDQFAAWRESAAGKQAFDLNTLATEADGKTNGSADAMDTDTTVAPALAMFDAEAMQDFEVCDRKKCARHLEWPKLAVDDLRFEMGDNGDRMRGLDREEKELKERAALRAKGGVVGGEGRVEVHGLGMEGVEVG
ncbi:COMPASS (complex proteins associated with Set1p) component [Saxophila tyrrhenica]|uniref:COMPASS (Complex proteins associated with Set1p) component n=1 Tax=Saxophila tyrrhenica TaxID=1690608 RepID=A0AAV9PNC8_9PEZI|nr:COMPASS (complex proteins associated with Set1p) component [Saxophila tyrrhenica]